MSFNFMRSVVNRRGCRCLFQSNGNRNSSAISRLALRLPTLALHYRPQWHRRGPVVDVILFLLVLTRSSLALSDQVTITTNDIPGIKALSPNDASSSAVSALSEAAPSIAPYGIVVRNTGGLGITGIDVRYSLLVNGRVIVHNYFYGSPDLSSPDSPIIPVNSDLAIVPDHSLNLQAFAPQKQTPSPAQLAAISKTYSLFSAADTVMISVDSIIRSDGKMSGPDLSGTYDSFQRSIAGYIDFRRSLLKMFSDKKSDAEITAWLRTVTEMHVVKVKSGPNQPLDRGIVTKKLVAKEYLSYFEQGRRSFASDLLQATTPEVRMKKYINVSKENAQ